MIYVTHMNFHFFIWTYLYVGFVNHLQIMETSAFLTDPARQMRAFRDIHQALGLIEAA